MYKNISAKVANRVIIFLLIISRVLWTPLRYTLLVLCIILFRLRIKGLRHVPQSGSFILIANHQSYLDCIVVSLALNRLPHYVILGSVYNRVPKFFQQHIKCIPVQPGGKVIDTAVDILNKGYSICIFPEGRRTPDGKVHTFKRGFSELHKRTDVQILPVRISGAYDVWPTHKPFPAILSAPIVVDYFACIK